MAAKPAHIRRAEKVIRELDLQRRRIDSVGLASQLAFSSFDSGAGHGIDETDPETGQVVASFGTQFDGSHGAVPFTGPIPPTPTGVTLSSAPAVLSVIWAGVFEDDAVVTLDWTHVEIHASTDPGFTADFADTIIGTINTPRGGQISAVTGPGTWYVRLVSRSAAGKRSPASAPQNIVVSSTVDTAAIEADLAAAEGLIADAKARADAAFTEAGNASTAAGTAQSTATAAATAAGNASTAAGAAQTTANTANTAAANALKKFTVSANIPSGTGNAGDIWWRKDANGAIIGQWEWATTPTPAGWKPRTTDGGIISNMAVTNLVAGSGTMSTGVIDKLFSDVVVARMAVATSFIGENAILTGAITAPKITASEQLTAKVAQFLQVDAGMINTNSLWADSAWLAKARTHLLEVLSNTNGEGYTSTITGQGLRVTRTISGNTFDVIRLGTFGADYIAVSDGQGNAVASISDVGDIGASQLYSSGDVYAGGRVLTSDYSDLAKGEVAFAEHRYESPNTPATWSTSSTTGVGAIEVSFIAERGRVYMFTGDIDHYVSATGTRVGLHAVWRIGGLQPTVAVNDGTAAVTDASEDVRANWLQSNQMMGRFVPFPFSGGGTGAQTTVCRVLFYARRTLGSGVVNLRAVKMSVCDMGVQRAYSSHFGHINSNGTSTLPTVNSLDVTHPAESANLRVFRRTAGSTGTWTYYPTITDRVMQGTHAGFEYISFLQFPALRNEVLSNTAIQSIEEISLSLTPSQFPNAMGRIQWGLAQQGTGAGSTLGITATNVPGGTSWYPDVARNVGAWPTNQPRTLIFSSDQVNHMRAEAKQLYFGGNIPDAEKGKPMYAASIPLSSISMRIKYRKRA